MNQKKYNHQWYLDHKDYFKSYRLNHKDKINEYKRERYKLKDRKYYKLRWIKNIARLSKLNKEWREKNKDKINGYTKKYVINHREQRDARNAIRKLKISAKQMNCFLCKEKALEWHHYKGYKKENWLNVIPLCHKCHTLIHSNGEKDEPKTS